MKKFKAETIVARLFASVTDRVKALRDEDKHIPAEFKMIQDHLNPEGKSYRAMLHAVEQTKSIFDFEPLMNCIGKHKMNGANDASYLQAKTIEKVIKFVKAMGNRDFRMLDNHTRSLIVNTMVNNGCISSLAAFATLTKVDSEEISEIIRARNSYSHGTANSQKGSSRELFRIMGVTTGIKGAKGEGINLTDAAKQAFAEHFEQVAKLVPSAVVENDYQEEGELADAVE